MDFSILEQLEPRFLVDKHFLASVIKNLALPTTSRILDIGTGWGKMSIYLALHGYTVITGEPEKWSEWESHTIKAGVRDKIQYQKMNAEELDFQSNSIDAIFLLGSFHHIHNKKKAFSEFLRVIKDDGVIILFDYTNKRIEQIKKQAHHHPPAVNVKEYFEDLSVNYTFHLDSNEEVFCYIIKKN